MSVLDLVRDDLRAFSGYLSARKQNSTGEIWLNANEAALPHRFDTLQLNRYPEPQPQALKEAVCDYYRVSATHVLLTRGSDEAIDLLVRAVCVPGQDSVAIASPTFGMYAVCARLHACPVIDVPLQQRGDAFEWDIPALIATVLNTRCKLVFICTPANPTGQSLATEALETLLRGVDGHCLVVVDEAYAEYSAMPSALGLLERYNHLAVLKTLSKAHALAGARIGLVAAAPEFIAVLKACQAPYPISKPSAELAVNAFAPENRVRTHAAVQQVLTERARMAEALRGMPSIIHVFDSDANFLLVRCHNCSALAEFLLQRGIVVRAMSQYPALQDALRISIGTPAENTAVLELIQQFGVSNRA